MRIAFFVLISLFFFACNTPQSTTSNTDTDTSTIVTTTTTTSTKTTNTTTTVPTNTKPKVVNNGGGAAPRGGGANFKLPVGRFDSAIAVFEAEDTKNRNTNNAILFTGSSSIRFWTTLQEDMQDLPVLNRGFGGSTIPEVLHYQDRYLFQHKPQIVVFYCGENDIAAGASPSAVFKSFQEFSSILEERLPDTKLVFISMKPSIARWSLWDKYQAGNAMIKDFIDRKTNMTYIDCGLSMLKADNQVKEDIFVEDGLHMNAKGYAAWTQQIYPILKGLYTKK